ncbi:hypothetical protein GOHSU_28_00250 [Gordonia hirsuta DSM 44140 = NBRC 16056]|uniref:Uncharacterized protein n=1 Tax=Gordonia hirsuta DSM 44140 = NBRC 16056 TaxID=1121927 RepID=L7LA31_9ACTN|nr:hypothetical protein GOHSU_28_00250 [Gordonia hirsuta DSM 44140 = NBRC 16056]
MPAARWIPDCFLINPLASATAAAISASTKVIQPSLPSSVPLTLRTPSDAQVIFAAMMVTKLTPSMIQAMTATAGLSGTTGAGA